MVSLMIQTQLVPAQLTTEQQANVDKLEIWQNSIIHTVDDLFNQFEDLPIPQACSFVFEALTPMLAKVNHFLTVTTEDQPNKLTVNIKFINIGTIDLKFDVPTKAKSE